MFKSSLARWSFGVLAFLVVISALRFRPWERWNAAHATVAKEELTVGYLPVTCHLTCPVTGR